MRRGRWFVPCLLAACATPPRWQDDLSTALSTARAEGRELVVFFALAGRDASDRMQGSLDDPQVLSALAAGDYAAVIADGAQRERLYRQWVGFGEGMGIAIVDAAGRIGATRPGPQDPDELAAFLRLCTASRAELAAARVAVAQATVTPLDQHRLGCILLQLGCRLQSEPLLLDAAMAGVADARHRLARLYALDGNLAAARRWLASAPKTAAAQVTQGYVLYKERRHQEAILALEAALADGQLGSERQRALLLLGKALHEDKQDARARLLLQALIDEGTGSVFEAAARHTLGHILAPQHGHAH